MDEKDRAQCAADFALQQLALLRKDYSFSGYERDLVALNLGNGRYMDISGVSGADSLTDGRGAVYADFDNDGDLDIFVRAMHGPAHLLYRNEVGQDSGFVRITLAGDAFGAVVRLKTSAGILTKLKSGGRGFLSGCDPRLLFGLGKDEAAEWLEVMWPGGKKQRFAGPKRGASLRIAEGAAAPVPVKEKRFRLGGAR